MTRAYSTEQVRARLTEWIATHGKASAIKHFGCSLDYLQKVQRGATPPGPKILYGLNLQRVYVEARPTTTADREG